MALTRTTWAGEPDLQEMSPGQGRTDRLTPRPGANDLDPRHAFLARVGRSRSRPLLPLSNSLGGIGREHFDDWATGVNETEATDGDLPLSRHELRQLEARRDARFQAVNARFISVDGRFVQIGDQVGEVEQRIETMKRYERRFTTIDNRLDATSTHVDHVRLQLSSQLDNA